MKRLIIYLSATGNTERVAQEISNQLGDADLYPIHLKTKIPKSEFWRMIKIGFFMWLGKGMRFSTPKIDTSAYDQIIVGTPVWMGKAAIPVITVLKNLQVNEKVVGLFATCGVDPGNVFDDIIEKCSIPHEINHLSITMANLTDDNSMLDEINTFAHLLKKDDFVTMETPIHEG